MITPAERINLTSAMKQSLHMMALEDIKKASIKGEAKLAGFILGACLIDALAGFYDGVQKKDTGGSGERFKKFVKHFMPMYDTDTLYKDLRCGLVHSYAEGGTYVFTDANKAGKHFQKLKNGRILVNLEDFIADVEKAMLQLEKEIMEIDAVYEKAVVRAKSMGFMIVGPITDFS